MGNDTHVTDVRGPVHEATDLIYREVTGDTVPEHPYTSMPRLVSHLPHGLCMPDHLPSCDVRSSGHGTLSLTRLSWLLGYSYRHVVAVSLHVTVR